MSAQDYFHLLGRKDLVRAAVDQIRREHKQARAVCTYAKAWFERHPEEKDLLKG